MPIPYVPHEINLSDLKNISSNNSLLLLSNDEIERTKTILQGAKDGKYQKSRELAGLGIKINYDIIKSNAKFYALYGGENQNKFCGIGSLGVVKYAQELDSSDWIAAKIQTAKANEDASKYAESIRLTRRLNQNEYDILGKMGSAFGSFERVSPTKGLQDIILMRLIHGMTFIRYLAFFGNASSQHFNFISFKYSD